MPDSVYKLENKMEKEAAKPALRRLWRDCFHDPLAYEDFYFQNVYRKNTVYVYQKDRKSGSGISGMIHLNPYLCRVEGKEMCLPYIVGVATAKEARRRGIMRRLLSRALWDLYVQKTPFTYLMPADARYYLPFDFVSVSGKEEQCITARTAALPDGGYLEKAVKSSLQRSAGAAYENRDILYVEYHDLEDSFGENTDRLFSSLDLWLEAHYSGFASHNREYFEQLAKEKESENGAVIFCFDKVLEQENLLGFFAFGREEGKMIVEQNVFFEPVKWNQTGSICAYPYMVRVVHIERFLALFADCFLEYAMDGRRLCVEDALLGGLGVQQGKEDIPKVYTFEKTDKVSVHRQSGGEYDVKMTVAELARFVFEEKGKKLFFAEMV